MASSSLPIVDGGSGISTCLRTVRRASVGSLITFSDCERFACDVEARFLADTAIAVYETLNDVNIDSIVNRQSRKKRLTHLNEKLFISLIFQYNFRTFLILTNKHHKERSKQTKKRKEETSLEN